MDLDNNSSFDKDASPIIIIDASREVNPKGVLLTRSASSVLIGSDNNNNNNDDDDNKLNSAECDVQKYSDATMNDEEFLRYVIIGTLMKDKHILQKLLTVAQYKSTSSTTIINNNDDYDEDLSGSTTLSYVNLLEPLFSSVKPRLSDILSISHVTCEDCCNLYTPGHVSRWIVNNPELFDSEIYFFEELLDKFEEHIRIDIVPYEKNVALLKLDNDARISTQSEEEKLKQLYTVILYHDEYDDVDDDKI